LVDKGLLSPAQLAEAELQQPASGKPIGALLVELGLVDERSVAEAIAAQLGFPIIDLRDIEPEPDAVRRLPESLARSLSAIPIRESEGRIDLAVADPSDPALATDLVAAVAPLEPRLAVAAPSDIRRAIDSSYRALASVGSLVEAFEATEAIRQVEAQERVVSDDAPIVQVVNLVVTQGVRDRASDVHIEPQGGRVRVRFRIDGALHDVLALPDAMGPAIVSRIKIMADMNIVERRRAQDGQMVVDVDGRAVDVRIATSPTIWGEKVVLRLLDRSRTLYRLDDLGMTAATHDQFSKMMRSPYGMVICAGPTGSGKTTTLYATLTEINQTERNVTTIEDPVEYVFSSINQIQINEQAGLTFAAGLRAILRQDPDVILVGEVRDAETARIAVESALTGHFVLSSLHATDACSALQRLVDMGIEPFLIASTVAGVVSQRLVRRICDQCKEPYEPPLEELAFYEQARIRPQALNGKVPSKVATKVAVAERPQQFFQGRGCSYCSRTGYRDRVGVFELLPITDAIKALLVSGSSLDDLRATARRDGMISLLDGGIKLVDEGIATIPEIIRSIYVL
jgi:type IV pilus assembly protein PilB